jgi:hypothetical protein
LKIKINVHLTLENRLFSTDLNWKISVLPIKWHFEDEK